MSKPEELKTGAAVYEDDDFEFGTKAEDTKSEAPKDDGDDAKPDDDDETGKEDVAESSKAKSDGIENEDAVDDIAKSGDGKEDGEKKKEDTKKEEVSDIFAGDDVIEEGDKLSLKKLASGLEVDLEKDDVEEFTTKVKQKIANARQEFKLDDYPEDAKAIIKHLKENDGKIEDFFNNKNIVSLQGVMNLSPEEKVLQVRVNELRSAGISLEKAREQANDEIEALSTKEIKNHADKIDDDARSLISKEITKITGDRAAIAEEKRNADMELTKRQVREIKKYVEDQKEFLGIPLSNKAKQNIIRDIETGAFDHIANESPASSKFTAYMMAKFGKNIMETIKKTASEQNRKGFNAANEKNINALHKTKDSAQQGKTGHQQSKSGQEGRFDGFLGAIDED